MRKVPHPYPCDWIPSEPDHPEVISGRSEGPSAATSAVSPLYTQSPKKSLNPHDLRASKLSNSFGFCSSLAARCVFDFTFPEIRWISKRTLCVILYRNIPHRHVRLLTSIYHDTRREHHPAAPHAYELPPRQRPRRLARPSPRRPLTRFLPQAARPHSPNPRLGRWTIPANLPIARPTASAVPPVRVPPYPRFGFSLEPVP